MVPTCPPLWAGLVALSLDISMDISMHISMDILMVVSMDISMHICMESAWIYAWRYPPKYPCIYACTQYDIRVEVAAMAVIVCAMFQGHVKVVGSWGRPLVGNHTLLAALCCYHIPLLCCLFSFVCLSAYV